MPNLIYKLILENSTIKYTNLNSYIILRKKKKIKNNFTLNIKLNTKTNGTLLLVHTENKNKIDNIIYKNVTLNIVENTCFTIINLFSQNNNYNVIFFTKLNLLLKKNSNIDSYVINNMRSNVRNYIKIQNILKSSSKLTFFTTNIGTTIFNTYAYNVLWKNSLINFYVTLQTKKKQINFFNIKTTHLDNNSCSNHICRIVAEENTKTLIKVTVTVNKNITNTETDTNCKTLTLGNSTNIFMPFLKIYNNVIKCTHSACVGGIENKLIYYMQTRGLSKNKAYKIIAHSFTKELINKIKNTKLLNYLKKKVFLLDE